MREILFSTPHGSRLYGLHHADSDVDTYTVVSVQYTSGRQPKARYAKQNINGKEDNFVVDFGTWVEMCKSGVPQALEAMFSQQATVDRIADFRNSFVVSSGTWEKYLQTIKSFALSEDNFKKKRHALRLALNLNELARCGRFNPTLNPSQILMVNNYAEYEDVYSIALQIAWL